MKLYHRTACPQQILDGGFRDATGTYLTSEEWTGVWFWIAPLTQTKSPRGSP